MNKSDLILLTGNSNFFGQTRKPWVSLDVGKLRQELENQGFRVKQYSFHQIVNGQEIEPHSLIFYTFSQKYNRRMYIRDLIYQLHSAGHRVIPPYDLLLCHENKGFQELYKKKVGLDSFPALYLSGLIELDQYNLEYPLVLKTPDGSNGKGVYLIYDEKQLRKTVNYLNRPSFLLKLDLFRRKYLRLKKHYPEYPAYSNRTDYWQYRDYILPETNFLLQPFVPELTYDNRILVFYDKYFVVRRNAIPGDFRASGTKRFDFKFDADAALLEFAESIYQKMNSGPFLAMDIGRIGDQFFLFEFQAIHFGITTVIKNKGYYRKEKGVWHFDPEIKDFETELAEALSKFIRSRV